MTVRLVAGAAAPPAGAYDADIVILALDRAEATAAAIASALDQRGARCHLTVLDQGSRPEALAQFAALIEGRADASLYASAENLGVAGGRNLASGLGHGRAIVGLDNDATFDGAATVAGILAALDVDPGLAALGLRIVADATGGDDLSSWGYPRALLARAGERFEVATFVGAGHAIRRSAWAAAGGYDSRLFFCWEEYDFCLRAIAQGWRIGYRGDLVVRHKVSAEHRVAWSGRRWFFFVRNRLLIERKWGASWPELMPRVAGYWAKGARSGLGGETWRAVAAAAAMEPGAARPLPAAARAYLARVDGAHRDGFVRRVAREILAGAGG